MSEPSPLALAAIQCLDVAAIGGDELLVLQEELGLSALEVAELLFNAFIASGRAPLPGSIAKRLVDSDSGASFPYARYEPYEPDGLAPRLGDIGTVKIGAYEFARMGLGCMRLLSSHGLVDGVPQTAIGIPYSPEAARHALLTAIDVGGVGYVDVARGYGPWPGWGERLLVEWTRGASAKVLVASKVGYRREVSGSWLVDLDPAFIAAEIAASVRQFGGRVPLLYLVVKSTATTPVVNRPARLADAWAPLVEAQRQGLVEHIGVANVSVAELDELNAAGAGEARVDVVQNPFTITSLHDPAQRAVLDRCGALGIPFVAWGLFAEGARTEPTKAFVDVAAALGATPEQLIIRALLGAAPHLVALPGPARRATIYSCIQGANLDVDDDTLRKLLG
ncbi:MAG: aldo/keto reductase [Deltaproteobacteria bacterium]|nr:aldo/keto reductase [Deltaproteobacteria bacterium]